MEKTMLKSVAILLLVLSVPVINPDNAKPGDWFTPTNTSEIQRADDAATRAYQCAVLKARTGLDCGS